MENLIKFINQVASNFISLVKEPHLAVKYSFKLLFVNLSIINFFFYEKKDDLFQAIKYSLETLQVKETEDFNLNSQIESIIGFDALRSLRKEYAYKEFEEFIQEKKLSLLFGAIQEKIELHFQKVFVKKDAHSISEGL